MSLQHGWYVWHQKGHTIALSHANLFQGTRQLIYPSVELAIGVTHVLVYNGGLVGIDKGATFEKLKRIQSLVPDMVPHGHRLLRLRPARLPMIASLQCSSILLDHVPCAKKNLARLPWHSSPGSALRKAAN